MGTSKLGWKSVRIVRNHFSQNLAGRRAMCKAMEITVFMISSHMLAWTNWARSFGFNSIHFQIFKITAGPAQPRV